MEPLIDVVANLGLFVAGLALRALAFAAILAVLVLPILLVLGGVEGLARLRARLLGVTRVGSLRWRPDLFYAPGHTWIQGRGRSVTVGLDDLAQRLLPGLARLKLPDAGSLIQRGEPMTTVRADGAETSILSPVTGRITAVNRAVGRDPSLVHRDPYVRGWLFRVEATDAVHERFPRHEGARRWFASEATRLERMLEHELGFAAADGGELVLPVHELLGSGRWRRVTDAFLQQS